MVAVLGIAGQHLVEYPARLRARGDFGFRRRLERLRHSAAGTWRARKARLDPKRILGSNAANADPAERVSLCTTFFQHPDRAIRTRCAVFRGMLREDETVRIALWEMIRTDPEVRIRNLALYSLIEHHHQRDIPEIVQHYVDVPAARPTVDEATRDSHFVELRQALDKRMRP